MGIYEFKLEDAKRFASEQGIKTGERGDELQFLKCPYCGNKTNQKNSFSINVRTGQFKCLRASCGAHGNMLTLARDFNFSLGNDVDEYYNSRKRFKQIHRKEYPTPTPAAIAYLEGRGISKKTIQKYHITSQKKNDNIIVFPFYDENNILQYAKYRKSDFNKERDRNKEWCEANCKPILFGMDQCNPENKTLVMTEGQIDSLSVAEAGIENAVSVPNGAKGFTWVPYCWDFMSRFDTLIIFGDHEHDKITLLEEMRSRFHGAVKHVREQDYKDCKDANEILRKYGVDAIREAVRNAEPVKNPRIIKLVDVERLDIDEMERFSTGLSKLDEIIGGFYFGQLAILTGKRGLGKSTLASQFGVFAIKEGHSVFFYSGELLAGMFKEWFERQVAGGKCINGKRDKFRKMQYSVNAQALPEIERWYGEHAYFYDNSLVIDSDTEEDETLIQTMRTAATQYGCSVFFIDNLMTAMEDDISCDIYRQQSNFVKELARFAKEFNAFVVLVAHPKKDEDNFSADSILGSSNITNLCDIILRYAEPKSGSGITAPRVLQVWKNRLDGKLNKEGIPLYYQDSSKRVSEDEKHDWKLGWEGPEKDAGDGFQEVIDEEIPF